MVLFKPEFIPAIRSGEKTATRRDWQRQMCKPGRTYTAKTQMFKPRVECDCFIHVTAVGEEPLGAMTEHDAQKEGGYSLAEFRDVWAEMNGEWDPALPVTVVEFEYVGDADPKA